MVSHIAPSVLPREVEDFYLQPGPMTDPGPWAELLRNMPSDIAGNSRLVQGLLLHEHWAGSYGQTLSAARREESQLRPVSEILSQIARHDSAPVTTPRPPERRVVGVCRHFAVLSVALLRAHGVPARARCGFGAYFNRGTFADHWVVEYWNREHARWVLADSQLDEIQRRAIEPDFNTLDVPRDKFLVAGDAWSMWRTAKAEARKFGIFGLRGAWFIAGNVLRDLAALNNMEMLPWDVWGPMVQSDDAMSPEMLASIDRAAELVRIPDDRFKELRALYRENESLRVPAKVFNAIRQREEEI